MSKMTVVILLLLGVFLCAAEPISASAWKLNHADGGTLTVTEGALQLIAAEGKLGAVVFAGMQDAKTGEIYLLSVQASGSGTLEGGAYLYGKGSPSFLGRAPAPMEIRQVRGSQPRRYDFYLTIPDQPVERIRPCLRVGRGEITIASSTFARVEQIPPAENALDQSRRMDNEWLPVFSEPNLLADSDFNEPARFWQTGGTGRVTFADREMRIELQADGQRTLVVSEPIDVYPGDDYILTGLYQSQNVSFGTFGELMVVPEERVKGILDELDKPQVFSSFSGRELYNRRAGDWQRVVESYKTPAGVKRVRLVIVQHGRPCLVRWSSFYFGLGPWDKDNRSREYDWSLQVNNLDPLLPEEEVKATLDKRPTTEAWLDKGDYPRIMVNGQVKAPLIYFGDAFKPSRSKLQDFQKAGVDLQLIPLLQANRYWRGQRDYAFEAIDEAIWDNVRRNPQGHFMVILSMTPYDNWASEFPQDVALDASGQAAVSRHGRQSPPSYWSQVYREQARHYIRSAVSHMRQQPYFKTIAGFFITGNEDGQFYYQVARSGRLEDGYSPAVLPTFRNWLQQRYGTAAALQQAWKQPDVDFASALPPPAKRERNAVFFDPSREQAEIDLTRFLNESMGDFANAMCQEAKDAAGKRVLALMWWGRGGSLMVYPHLAQTRRIFPAGSLDLMGAQPGYRGERNAGCSVFQPWVTDSARSHGKMMMCEADFRTWVSPVNSLLHDAKVVRFWSEHDMRGVFRRELGRMLSVGGGLWFYDMTAGWFKDPVIMQEVATMRQIADRLVSRENVFKPSEIVLVSDEDNYYTSTEQLNIWNGPNFHCVRKNQRAWLRSGLKFDFYYFNDLLEGQMTGYKVYVFLNAFSVSAAQKQFISEKLQRDGKLLVWLYAPGYVTAEGFSVAAMQALTGITIAQQEKVEREAVFVDSPLSRGLAGNRVGMDNKIGTLGFAVNDEAAVPVMRYRDSGQVAGALRVFADYQSLYLALPVSFSPEFLQQLATYAGVHVYNRTPGDFFMHRRDDLIALHGVEGKENRIVLPDPQARLYELPEGKLLQPVDGEFRIPLQPGETRLFEIGRP